MCIRDRDSCLPHAIFAAQDEVDDALNCLIRDSCNLQTTCIVVMETSEFFNQSDDHVDYKPGLRNFNRQCADASCASSVIDLLPDCLIHLVQQYAVTKDVNSRLLRRLKNFKFDVLFVFPISNNLVRNGLARMFDAPLLSTLLTTCIMARQHDCLALPLDDKLDKTFKWFRTPAPDKQHH